MHFAPRITGCCRTGLCLRESRSFTLEDAGEEHVDLLSSLEEDRYASQALQKGGECVSPSAGLSMCSGSITLFNEFPGLCRPIALV